MTHMPTLNAGLYVVNGAHLLGCTINLRAYRCYLPCLLTPRVQTGLLKPNDGIGGHLGYESASHQHLIPSRCILIRIAIGATNV